MSPEQKENTTNTTFASDIFSLGVITYELVIGKLSYGMVNLSLLPAGLQRIIGKALAVSPSERYQDSVEFITAITDYYKSPEIEKERPNTDQVVEIMEVLQKAEQALSTLEKPSWPQFSIGLVKERNPEQLGHYLDFFRFSNNTMAIILARTHSSPITSSTYVAVLRGMIKSLIHPYLTTDIAFDLMEFAATLNALVYHDKMQETFHLDILKLIPYNDTLSYLSCGTAGPLFHVPQGSNAPRTIHSENPLIGKELASSFVDAEDTFNDGDLLLFHDLPESFEPVLAKTLQQNLLLSSNRLCDALLKAIATQEAYKEYRHPKAILALQRIS